MRRTGSHAHYMGCKHLFSLGTGDSHPKGQRSYVEALQHERVAVLTGSVWWPNGATTRPPLAEATCSWSHCNQALPGRSQHSPLFQNVVRWSGPTNDCLRGMKQKPNSTSQVYLERECSWTKYSEEFRRTWADNFTPWANERLPTELIREALSAGLRGEKEVGNSSQIPLVFPRAERLKRKRSWNKKNKKRGSI